MVPQHSQRNYHCWLPYVGVKKEKVTVFESLRNIDLIFLVNIRAQYMQIILLSDAMILKVYLKAHLSDNFEKDFSCIAPKVLKALL